MPLKDNKENYDNKIPVNYKSRLEKKLCLAQESPEPVFDISDCNLKTIPSNVFALCRVLRKEALYVQNNIITNLSSGGLLADLKNLKVLNISSNKLSKLPSNINELECLEFFDVTWNQLTGLPETIGGLSKLEVFNLSHNNLKSLPDSIGNCKNLQVLDLTWNENLKKLPVTLAKLHSLAQLNIEPSTIAYPPQEVCNQGIYEILKFLSKELNEDIEIPSTSVKVQSTVPRYDNLQEKIEHHEKLKLEKQNERLRLERELMNQNQKEIEIQQKLKDNKKKLLENVKSQQDTLDVDLIKLQEKKSFDRALLVKLCQDEEKHSSEVVGKILNLKRNLQLQYTTEWEKERKAEEELLWNYTSRSRDIERKQILVSMEEMMREEIHRVQKTSSDQRLLVVQSLASEIAKENNSLSNVMKKRNENRNQLINSLHRDEELQKSAVASLLEKSDAASWELGKQITIVENQLADLTRLEISKKKLESEHKLTELNKNRIALTELLMDLLDRQTARRNQLIESIRRMEAMKQSARDTELFWLEQYDKLLNSRSHEMVKYLDSINTTLVHELYINGVFHYLPLLKDVLAKDKVGEVNEDVLIQLGVKSREDRSKIIRAIKSFLKSQERPQIVPTAPLLEEPSAPPLDENRSLGQNFNASYLVPDECVVCLERKANVIFIPCGHICCCFECFKPLTSCPLCRKPIQTSYKRIES